MKKLMVIVGLAVAAMASQAAQVKWQMTATKADAAKGDGLNVYMILANNWQDQWQSASEIIGKSAGDPGKFTIGAKSATSAAVTYASSSIGVGDTIDYYLVMVSDAGYLASGKITSSAATSDGTDRDPSSGALIPASTPTTDQWKSGSAIAGTWSTYAAPEPTSGLLLLLGVAGLALRRRRA